MKQCNSCYREKDESSFHKKQACCKECRNKKQRDEYRADLATSRLVQRLKTPSPDAEIRKVMKIMRRYEIMANL